mgnify:CR=1 FL=1
MNGFQRIGLGNASIEMVFKITKHAKERMLERNIKPPTSSMVLKCAGKKLKKRIRERCVRKGVESGKIYWVKNDGTVYVCAQEDVGVYCVITAFNLNENEKQI